MLPGEGIPERVSEAIQRQNEAQDAFLQRYRKALMLLDNICSAPGRRQQQAWIDEARKFLHEGQP